MDLIRIDSIIELINETHKMSQSDRELLVVYNRKFEQIGLAPRYLCHKLGLIHRVVYLFIENESGLLLLQTRKDGNIKRLDIAVGGHVINTDETIIDGLIREVKEEIHFDIDKSRIYLVNEYFRINNKKPGENNEEIRSIFKYTASNLECEIINQRFSGRIEQNSVLEINWFMLKDVLNACSESNCADGLESSIAYYILSQK